MTDGCQRCRHGKCAGHVRRSQVPELRNLARKVAQGFGPNGAPDKNPSLLLATATQPAQAMAVPTYAFARNP